MKKIREEFLEIIKKTPCFACGKYGVDIAHVKPWSERLGGFTRRTHKGIGWFFAIPLCRHHHLQLGSSSEHLWLESNIPGGLVAVYGWIAKTVAKICSSDGKRIQRIHSLKSASKLAAEVYAMLQLCQADKGSR